VIIAIVAIIGVTGCLGGVPDYTTHSPEPETESNPVPPEKDATEVRGTITGESLEGYTVKVNIIAENNSAYKCSVPTIKNQIENSTKADALSIRPDGCEGAYVKMISFT